MRGINQFSRNLTILFGKLQKPVREKGTIRFRRRQSLHLAHHALLLSKFILNKREIKIHPLIVVDCALPLAFIAAFFLLELEQTDLAISCLLKNMADFTGSLASS